MTSGDERAALGRRRGPGVLVALGVASAWLAAGYALQACGTESRAPGRTAEATADAGFADATTIDSTAGDARQPDAAPEVDGPASAGDARRDVTADASFDCPKDGGLPDQLSCTGLYSDWSSKTIAPEAVPYTPGYILWSDGAVKSRWISIPAGTRIDTSNLDEWVFPVGTKIWKQFQLNGQLVETRFMWKQVASAWTYADYRWSADGSSAPLLTNGEQDVDGTTYEVPSLNRCPSCHGGRVDAVLGFDLVGTGVPAASGLTLAALAAQGLLTDMPPATSIVIPEDSTQQAAAALGWLHVNCGVSCHNANPSAMGGPSGLYLKLLGNQMYPDGGNARVSQLDSYTTSVGVVSNLTPNGQHYLRIAAGDAAQSLIPLMDMARGDAGFKAMPPIVSHLADTADVALVMGWISAL